MVKITQELLSELELFDSATVQNAGVIIKGYTEASNDYTNPDISRHVKIKNCRVGIAHTSTWTPITPPKKDPANKNDFYDSILNNNLPTIAVLKDVDIVNKRGAIIGDGMAYIMNRLGAVGAIVDGNSRDILGIKKSGLDLWSTGVVPGHAQFEMIEYNISLSICDLTVNPGDILVCDDDGITKVNPELLAETVKVSHEVRQKESNSHKYFLQKDFTKKKWEDWKRSN